MPEKVSGTKFSVFPTTPEKVVEAAPVPIFRCQACGLTADFADPVGTAGRPGNCEWCHDGILTPLVRVGEAEELENLEEKVSSLESDLEDAEQEAKDEKERADDLKKDVDRLEKEVSNRDDQIWNLEQQVKDLETKLSLLTSQDALKAAHIIALDRELSGYKSLFG